MSLASSWPDPAKDTSPKARKRVGPLSEPTTPSTTQPPEWPDDDSKRSGKVQSSSIPLKPTLARSASKKTKHVPPLQLNEKGSAAKSNFSDAESERSGAYVISSSRGTNSDWDDEEDDIDRDQMKNSLMSLRNSAARKRAARRADSMTSSNTTSRSPSPHSMDESGIYSILYDTGSLEDSPKNTPKKKGKKNPDSPFSNRPRVARVSTSDREVSDTSRDSSRDTFRDSSRDSSRDTDTTRELEPNPFEFSPTGGVTFRDKVQSDVSVVGMGYGKNDVFRTDSPPIPTHQKGNARRKQNKGLLVSPLTMASLNHPGAVDTDDFTDEVGVIGKGVFGTSYAPPSHEYSGDRSKRGKERKDSESGRNGLPPGVYGIGVKQNSTEDNESSDDEEPSSISMSKSTKDKMARIQQEKKEELEQRKAEKQAEKEKQQRDREKWQKQQEKERIKAREQKEKIKKMDSTSEEIGLDTLTISGSGSNTLNTSTTKSKVITGKPPVATTPKKKSYKSPSSDASMETTSTPKNSSKSKLNRSSSQHDPDDDGEELKPFTNPESSLRDCLRFMNQDDWEVKLDGIRYVRRLTIFHPDVLNLQLHTVIVALLKEIKNLRSSVSRAAICTVADMFTHLRSSLDKDMDQLCKVLLHKAGESNGFIREDVDKSLAAMVESVTPQRALVALVAGGASHRSIAVRKTCAQFLVGVVERMGPGRLLSGIKDITDKIVPTAAQFCVDGSPETRYYGRKIMYKLMNHEDFEKLLAKYVPHKDLRQVREILEKLRVDGLGEMPSETPSARARRTYPSSGSGMRTNSGSREKINSAGSNADPNGLTPPSSTRKIRRSPRMDEASMATVQNLCSGLSASDWRDRYKAVQDFLDMTAHNVDLVVSNIIKIFDSYTPRLSDSNSKVNLTALTAMLQIVPRLREYIGAVINSVVPVLATNLASKNAQIHQTTLSVLDSLVEHVENSLLLQPFANVAQYGNARIKPCMIDKLAYLSTKVYPRKQQTVVRQVLPVLWHLLSNTSGSGAVPGGTGNIRTATTNLANTLFALMGQSLLDQAQSVLTPRNYKTLQDMLENQ
ncbi:TOG array regulator of axonemal microtubules protein 1-like [Saccoglossus kowalevskii]